MDPYCVVAIGGQRHKTTVASGAGKFPNWQDQLVFQECGEDIISIAVYDFDNIGSDVMIGEGALSVQAVVSRPNWEEWVAISHRGIIAGEVRLNISFNPDGGFGMQGYPQPMYGGFPPQGAPYGAFPPPPMQNFGYPPNPPMYQPYPLQGYPQYPPENQYPPYNQYPPGNYPPGNYPPDNYPPGNYPEYPRY